MVAITVTVAIGIMLRYDPGVMEDVVRRREAMGQITVTAPLTAYVAVVDCQLLGEPVWVVWPDGRRTMHVVGDCSRREDRALHQSEGLAVEVSYDVAVRYSLQQGGWLLPLDGPLGEVRVVQEILAPLRSPRRAFLYL